MDPAGARSSTGSKENSASNYLMLPMLYDEDSPGRDPMPFKTPAVL